MASQNSMQRLIIICEGETEQEFCKEILYHHLLNFDIIVQCPKIKKTNGGIAHWSNLKLQIENHCKQDHSCFVTTLIDYYGIKAKHEFPSMGNADDMQVGMLNGIDSRFKNRFFPYLQLHEFESLLFHAALLHDAAPTSEKWLDKKAFERTLSDFPNPEDINDNPETCPSARLQKLIKRYNKPVYGIELARFIGLESIRAKNPRFDAWIRSLEGL
jgi:hypothetical protein